MNCLPAVANSISVGMLPVPLSSLYISFVHLSSRGCLLCQALLCPACWISSTLELPASVLLKSTWHPRTPVPPKADSQGDLSVSWKAPKVQSFYSQGFAGILSSYLQQFETQLLFGHHDQDRHCSPLGPRASVCLQTIPGITFPSQIP